MWQQNEEQLHSPVLPDLRTDLPKTRDEFPNLPTYLLATIALFFLNLQTALPLQL